MIEKVCSREDKRSKIARLLHPLGKLGTSSRNREHDDLTLEPYLSHGHGGGIAEYHGPSGPIGVLARIEINEKAGRDLGDGLPPNLLN